MSARPPDPSVAFSRRLLAASAVALPATPPLVVAARQGTATPVAGGAGGSWTFTDDFGVTASRPRRPERVVAYLPLAAGLWDFGVRPIAVFGTTRRPDGSPEVYAGAVDLDAVRRSARPTASSTWSGSSPSNPTSSSTTSGPTSSTSGGCRPRPSPR